MSKPDWGPNESEQRFGPIKGYQAQMEETLPQRMVSGQVGHKAQSGVMMIKAWVERVQQ